MKKLVFIFTLIIVLLVPANAFASAARTEKTILADYAVQQNIYDENTKLSADYLDTLIHGKLSFADNIALQSKLKDSETKFLDAAKEMQKLRIELFELKNK